MVVDMNGKANALFHLIRRNGVPINSNGFIEFSKDSFIITINNRMDVYYPSYFSTTLSDLKKQSSRIELKFKNSEEYSQLIIIGSQMYKEPIIRELITLFKGKSTGMLQSAPAQPNLNAHLVTSFYNSSDDSMKPFRHETNKIMKAIPIASPKQPKFSLVALANSPSSTLPSNNSRNTSSIIGRNIESHNKSITPKSTPSANAYNYGGSTLKCSNPSTPKRSAGSQNNTPYSARFNDGFSSSRTKGSELIDLANAPEETKESQLYSNPFKFRMLTNIGNSCYMNATIQALASLDIFRKRFFRWKRLLAKGEFKHYNGFFVAFDKILRHLTYGVHKDEDEQILSSDILRSFRELCKEEEVLKQFCCNEQQDASEFLSSILDCLHTKMTYSGEDDPNIDPAALFRLETNKMIACKCGSTRDSIVLENILNLYPTGIRPSLQDLIKKYFDTETLLMTCDSCKSKKIAGLLNSIKKSPAYLIITLKRYSYGREGAEKLLNNVEVNRELFLKDICYDAKSKSEEKIHFVRSIRDAPDTPKMSPRKSDCTPLKDRNSENAYQPFSPESSFKLKEISPGYGAIDEENAFFPDDSHTFQCGGYVKDSDEETSPQRKRAKGDSHFHPVVDSMNETYSSTRPDLNKSCSVLPCTSSTSTSAEKVVTNIVFNPLKVQHIEKIRKSLNIGTSDFPLELKQDLVHKKCTTPLGCKPHFRDVDGDGNCLFRSLSWWLMGGSEDACHLLREKICDFMEKFKAKFEPFMAANDDMDYHVMKMREDAAWGTNIEISAAATLFQCVIFSYLNKWQIFRPLFLHKDGSSIEVVKPKDERIYDMIEKHGAIYIYNDSNVHFCPVYAPGRIICENGEEVAVKQWKETNCFTRDFASSSSRSLCFNENNAYSTKSVPYVFNRKDDPVYTLVSVVAHLGSSVNSGHYTSYSYQAEHGVWLYCDDSNIKQVDEATVLKDSGKDGYIFIYQKRKEGDENEFTPTRVTVS